MGNITCNAPQKGSRCLSYVHLAKEQFSPLWDLPRASENIVADRGFRGVAGEKIMPEELYGLDSRQSSYLSPSDGPNMASEQYAQEGVEEIPHLRAESPEIRSPELLRRALLRARENIQNKENINPKEPISHRRRRGRMVFTARSPLPADYPRAPLQDITHYMHALQRTRERTRRQRLRITHIRQPLIQHNPSQESPVQGQQEIAVPSNSRSDPQPDNQLQSAVPSGVPLNQEAIVRRTAVPVHTVPGLQQENQVPSVTPMRTPSLSTSTTGRVFGTVLQHGAENERNGMSSEDCMNGCVSKKSSKRSLMKMR